MEENNETELDYEVFDRQLKNFYRMLDVLIDAWDDYSPQELTFDLSSLCTKATRLCYMSEQDMVMQHNDLARQRKEKNEEHAEVLSIEVLNKLTPLMAKIVKETKNGHLIGDKHSKVTPLDMTHLLPKLNDFFYTDELVKGQSINIEEVMELQKELKRQVKPTHIAGVKPVERLWSLFQLYSMACYLLFQFRRLSHFTQIALSENQTARLFEMTLQRYQEEAKGAEEIDRYFTTLEYDNDGKKLSMPQLLEARKQLKDDVPENLRLAFMKYVRDTQSLGAQLAHIDFTPKDYLQLASATVKWQIIEQQLYEIQHPEQIHDTLSNEVFVKVKNGERIDMLRLKKKIAKMVEQVTRKNHWFCVWCVLKHHNLLRERENFEAFAHQMMSKDWFGDIDEYLHFTGDNLRDYRRYFSELDYTDWDEEQFEDTKETFHMTKWSTKLFSTFTSLCEKMNDAFLLSE